MASFPREGPKGRLGSSGRAQKKFVDREEAELFLMRRKKEYEERWLWEYWSDAEVRKDVARALGVISVIAGGSLEAAARVYVECVSAKEGKARGEYREPEKATFELSGRLGLGVRNLAWKRGVTIEGLVAGILWAEIEREAGAEEAGA